MLGKGLFSIKTEQKVIMTNKIISNYTNSTECCEQPIKETDFQSKPCFYSNIWRFFRTRKGTQRY